jgi:hypothetical protein
MQPWSCKRKILVPSGKKLSPAVIKKWVGRERKKDGKNGRKGR